MEATEDPHTTKIARSASRIISAQAGLVNLGNTCYANVVIQILRHAFPLTCLFITDDWKRYAGRSNDLSFAEHWRVLLHCFYRAGGGEAADDAQQRCISPTNFMRSVFADDPHFRRGVQCDIAEFLQYVLDRMHRALSSEVKMQSEGTPRNREDELMLTSYKAIRTHFQREYSIIVDLFAGQFYQRIHACDETLYRRPAQSETFDPFTLLPLDIPPKRGECTVYDCLDAFVLHEMLPEWRPADAEPPRLAQKRVMLWKLPTVLVVQLKRFAGLYGAVKNTRAVRFGLTLNLENYCQGYDRHHSTYSLFAVANHHGANSGCGHYVADCRDADGAWHRYNDEVVTPIPDPAHGLNPKAAYLLFYFRKE